MMQRTLMLLALSIAAAPPPRVARRPAAVVTIPNPKDAIRRLRSLYDWARRHSQAKTSDPDPLSIFPRIGLDASKPETLDANGIEAGAPAYLWLVGQDLPVLELAISSAERNDKLFARAVEKAAFKPLSTDGAHASPGASLVDPKLGAYVLVRDGKSLYIAIAGEPSPAGLDRGLRAIESAKIGQKPTRAPSAVARRKKDAPVWFEGAGGGGGVERFSGAAWLDPGLITIDADLELDMAGGLLVGDLASAAGSRPLFPGAAASKPALEATAHLSPTGLGTLLDALRIPQAFAGRLTGEAHVVVSKAGTLYGAAVLRPDPAGTETAPMEALLARAKERIRGVELGLKTEGGERLLIAEIRGEDARELEKLLWRAENRGSGSQNGSKSAGKAPIDLMIDPPKLIVALDRLGKKEPEIARDLARADLGSLKDISGVHVELSTPSGLVQTSIAIKYVDAPPPKR